MATEFLAASGGDPSNVFVSERVGHARDLAHAAIARGVSTIVAWGGDGTMNEVGSAAAFTNTSIALIPSGSGNGLARELGIPFDPPAALDIAVNGRDCVIDAGEIGGRLFFNVAGIGLDARVAHQFAANGLAQRGFSRYVKITLRELFRYVPDELTITTARASTTTSALLVAIANGRQYGNGAVVAPHARLDDGLLDIVIIEQRPTLMACLQLPLVFAGQIEQLSGVTAEPAAEVTISSPHPVVYHLDGEPIAGTLSIQARARSGALTIKVPEN